MELREVVASYKKVQQKKTNSQEKPTKPTKKSESKIHGGHRQRLKDQYLANGIDSLTDIQKLELLLFFSIPQRDTNPIAHALIDEFGTIKDVLLADTTDLMRVSGVKENTALHLNLVGKMLNVCSKSQNKNIISSTSMAKEYCNNLFVGIEVEQFYVICLSKSNKIQKVKMINSGSKDEINIQIRNITEFALSSKCNRIIVSHNHPVGLGRMSDEDIRFTYSLVCSCMLNSIDLLDHIVVGTDKPISAREQSILEKLKERAFKTIQIPQKTKLFLSDSSLKYITK